MRVGTRFAQHVASAAHDALLLAAMIGLAHDLGVDVVAGGVETPEQDAFSPRRECDFAQGFHFSRPQTATEIRALLTRR